MAPTGSSMWNFLSRKIYEMLQTIPPRRPIIIALTGETTAQPAVMATSPARAPFKVMDASGFLYLIQTKNMAAVAPAAAASSSIYCHSRYSLA